MIRLVQAPMFKSGVAPVPELLLVGMSWPIGHGKGWQSFDRQFEPYPCAIKAAPLRCGLDAVPNIDGRRHQ